MKYVKLNVLSVRTLGTSAAIWAALLVGCSGAGGEGGESGGSEGSSVPFFGDGVTKGAFTSPLIMANESYAGKLSGSEVAVVFSTKSGSFHGRVKNEAGISVCDVRLKILDAGGQVLASPAVVAGLRNRAESTFTSPVITPVPVSWTVSVETGGCVSAPTTGAGSGEGAGGAEGGTEGGSEGGTGTGAAVSYLIADTATGVFGVSNFVFNYDTANAVFRGTVTAPTEAVCSSRTEIHLTQLGSGGTNQVIELGPTIYQSLAVGETLNVVMGTDAVGTASSFVLHPESTPCI